MKHALGDWIRLPDGTLHPLSKQTVVSLEYGIGQKPDATGMYWEHIPTGHNLLRITDGEIQLVYEVGAVRIDKGIVEPTYLPGQTHV